MKCWHCNKELIWGGDHDIEKENEDYDMVTNLSCPKCYSEMLVFIILLVFVLLSGVSDEI